MLAIFDIFACKDNIEDCDNCATATARVKIPVDPAYAAQYGNEPELFGNLYREAAVQAAGFTLAYCIGCNTHKFSARFVGFVENPMTAVISSASLMAIVGLLNANTNGAICRDATIVTSLRRMLIADCVIKNADGNDRSNFDVKPVLPI